MAQSDIDNAGQKWACDILSLCFCDGAYHLGAVYETRAAEAAIRPGEGIQHASGADGEDGYIVMANGSVLAYGIAEIDFALVANTGVDMASGDNIPGIPFHMNPGAYCRNVTVIDHGAAVEPDAAMSSTSGTAGMFKDDGTSACLVRNAYYQADPGAATPFVVYIAFGMNE